MTKPDINFVVINYNYGDYVGSAVDSILGQCHENFRCIVVDNDSQDESRAVLTKYENVDDRLSVRYFDKNMNQMGAFLSLMDELEGRYVSIVDADDLIFADYAAMHLEAHRLLADEVAFTSNNVVEIDSEGRALTSGFDPFLRGEADESVQTDRCKSPRHQRGNLGDAASSLHSSVTRLPADIQGWHWSPGTANVYRLDLMRAARPKTQFRSNFPYVAATDNYFACLTQAIGGSAKIALPLSAYRLHGRNRFSGTESLANFRASRPLGTWRSIARHRDITREVTARPVDFLRLAPGRFWAIMDAPARMRGNRREDYFENPHVIRILVQNYDTLTAALGQADVDDNLSVRMGPDVFEAFKAETASSRLGVKS